MAADSLAFYIIHIVNTYHAIYWMDVIISKWYFCNWIYRKCDTKGILWSRFIKSWVESKEKQMFATYLRRRICSVKICTIASCENNDVNFSPIWHGDFHIYPPFVSLLRFMSNFCSIHFYIIRVISSDAFKMLQYGFFYLFGLHWNRNSPLSSSEDID